MPKEQNKQPDQENKAIVQNRRWRMQMQQGIYGSTAIDTFKAILGQCAIVVAENTKLIHRTTKY